NEEDAKIMDVMLSLPVPRWRLVLERFLAFSVIIIGTVLLTFAGLWVGIKLTPAMTIPDSRLFASAMNLLPSTLLTLALMVLLTSFIRNKNLATAIGVVVVIGSYVIDSVGRAASASFISAFRFISFYTYYDSTAVVRNGLNWGNVLILAVATVILLGG